MKTSMKVNLHVHDDTEITWNDHGWFRVANVGDVALFIQAADAHRLITVLQDAFPLVTEPDIDDALAAKRMEAEA